MKALNVYLASRFSRRAEHVFAHCVGMIFCPDAESAISYVCGLSVDGRGRVKVAA